MHRGRPRYGGRADILHRHARVLVGRGADKTWARLFLTGRGVRACGVAGGQRGLEPQRAAPDVERVRPRLIRADRSRSSGGSRSVDPRLGLRTYLNYHRGRASAFPRPCGQGEDVATWRQPRPEKPSTAQFAIDIGSPAQLIELGVDSSNHQPLPRSSTSSVLSSASLDGFWINGRHGFTGTWKGSL